jgi:hypothetical protein
MFFAALPLIAYLVVLFYRKPLLLLSLFPLVNLFGVFFPFYPMVVSGYWLLPMDFVYFFTIVHLSLWGLRNPRKIVHVLKENFFLTLFLIVIAGYVVVYTPSYGQSAVGEARKFYALFLFPLLASVSIKKSEDIRRLVLVVVLVATCVAVTGLIQGAMRGSIMRVINSEGTLIVTLAALSMIVHRIHRIVVINPILDRILLSVFSVIVLLSAQRSVWLAFGSGLSLMFWLYRSRSTVVAKMAVAVFMILLALSMGLALFPKAGSRLVEHFEGIIDPSADVTASWRMVGWQLQLTQLVKEGRLLFGQGVGGYYSWHFNTTSWTTVPHNAYVQIVLKFGLFGLSIYGLLALEFFRKTLAIRKKLGPGPMRAYVEMGILTFGAAHGYMLGYGFEPIMLIFFGLAISAAGLSQALRRSGESRIRRFPEDLKIPPRRFPPHRRPEVRPLYS